MPYSTPSGIAIGVAPLWQYLSWATCDPSGFFPPGQYPNCGPSGQIAAPLGSTQIVAPLGSTQIAAPLGSTQIAVPLGSTQIAAPPGSTQLVAPLCRSVRAFLWQVCKWGNAPSSSTKGVVPQVQHTACGTPPPGLIRGAAWQ